MKRTLLFAGAALTALVAFGGPVGAEPPRPNPIFAHQHFLDVDGQSGGNAARTEVVVGPDACEDGESRQFDEVHLNVHLGPSPVSGRLCP